MPAEVAWFDSDDVTPLGTVDLGVIQPGEDYFTKNGNAYRETGVKNTGDVDLSAVDVEIQQVGNFDAWERISIATGVTPGTFVDKDSDPLSLGALTQGSIANVWIQVVEPVTAVVQQGKACNLVATGAV